MKKDSYYFAHDVTMKDDARIELMIERLGCEGYGIYNILLETLFSQKDNIYYFANIKALARKYKTTARKIESVVKEFQLFKVDDTAECFYSDELNEKITQFHALRDKRREAGKKGAEARYQRQSPDIQTECSSVDDSIAMANAQQTHSMKGKEINETKLNEKESTETKETAPPSKLVSSLPEELQLSGEQVDQIMEESGYSAFLFNFIKNGFPDKSDSEISDQIRLLALIRQKHKTYLLQDFYNGAVFQYRDDKYSVQYRDGTIRVL